MALLLLTSPLTFPPSLPRWRITSIRRMHKTLKCSTQFPTCSASVARRSGNYNSSVWDFDFVESLQGDCKSEANEIYVEKLKEETRHLLKELVDPLEKMELVDTIQRLGLGYLFDREIKEVLTTIASSKMSLEMKKDLHDVALRFRLLRQHGFDVSPDVFNDFKNEEGGLKESLCMDIKGMLSLYEASHLSFQGELFLDEARAFTITHLKEIKGNADSILLKKVQHSLKLPLHWRMLRLEAKWYIDTYDGEDDKNSILLELAKRDFNKVQTIHQTNLKRVSRWWKDLALGEKLNFSRDRLVECFFWTIGFTFEPKFGRCREVLTKVNQLITTIDDVYDVYGSLDELQLFTDAVDRWDTRAMEQLPQYMQICFLALYNTTNETAYEVLKEEGWNVIPYLKKAWTDLCKAYLLEAKWYNTGYKPTLEEYLENAWISISGPVVLGHIYFSQGQRMPIEALNHSNTSNLIKWSSIIARLCDDLGTSKDEIARGDVLKSIQCYMHEAGVSENVARDHIKYVINEAWKKVNECSVNSSPLLHSFTSAGINIARMAHCMYENGDGFGFSNEEDKKRLMSLLAEPLTLM